MTTLYEKDWQRIKILEAEIAAVATLRAERDAALADVARLNAYVESLLQFNLNRHRRGNEYRARALALRRQSVMWRSQERDTQDQLGYVEDGLEFSEARALRHLVRAATYRARALALARRLRDMRAYNRPPTEWPGWTGVK